MNNASLVYEQIKSYSDIQGLVNQRTIEDIFLDFKETKSGDGKMLNDDKSLFSKAASGFAHQEGGVIVWGIEARRVDPKDPDSFDCATSLKPIDKVRIFCSELTKYISISTEPPVDGIQHKVILKNGDENLDKGFVVSFFPKSDEVHRALGPGKTRDRFYKRHGDSFVPLATADIRNLFFRSLSPDLELEGVRYYESNDQASLGFFVKNCGMGIARTCAVYFRLEEETLRVVWRPGDGSADFRAAQLSKMFPKHPKMMLVKLSPGVVIHPDEEIIIATATCSKSGLNTQEIEVEYKILSESMTPKEGSIQV